MSGSRVLARLSRVTPIGIQFVDEPTARLVADSLVVEIYPRGRPLHRIAAVPNRSGTFVVPRLPGPRDPEVEFGEGDDAFWKAVVPRDYVIEVVDTRGRFHAFTVDQPMPVKGLAVPSCLPLASPPLDGVPLFSTVSRPVPAGMAVIRAELMVPLPSIATDDDIASRPAAWAVLEARVGGQPPVRGMADRQGRVAILVAYPEPLPAPVRPASPPTATGTSLWAQQWLVRLQVFYEPIAPAPAVPDLCRTLAQPPAMLWADGAATTVVADPWLRYGQELNLRTLFVTPAGSPP